MGNLLQENDPSMTATIAATVAAILFFISILDNDAGASMLKMENRRSTAVTMRAKEILATTPDGLFLWDHIIGRYCLLATVCYYFRS